MQALLLFAQENAKQAEGGNPFVSMLPLLVILGFFFLFIVLPAQRKEKRQREQLKTNLKKNDEVVLNSGIIGIVQTIRENEDEITLKLEGDAKMRIKRSAIAYIQQAKESGTPAPPADTNIKK